MIDIKFEKNNVNWCLRAFSYSCLSKRWKAIIVIIKVSEFSCYNLCGIEKGFSFLCFLDNNF